MTARILIVDGVPTNRIVLRVKLAAAYYEVVQAATGAQALSAIGRHRPDLVIASAELPDMAAEAFCEAIKTGPETADIPVILVHAAPEPDDRLAALAAGADDFLSRPVDDLVLLARLRSLLRARDAEAELRLRDDTQRALGLAEASAGFVAPARIGLVAAGPGPDPGPALTALRAALPDRIEVMSPEQVLRRSDPAPEVFVIVEGTAGNGEGLSLLTELRASSATRHAAILYVAAPHQRREAATALDLGANDLLAGGLDPEELAIRLPKQIARKRTADQLRANMRDGLRAAVTDPLTGLYNRRYALPHLSRLADRAQEKQRAFAVLAVDIDHFKQINDQHGHAVGDEVLQIVADRLRNNLRAADLVARIGGEEFLIAMPDTPAETALRAARRLCRSMAGRPVKVPGRDLTLQITVSIGAAIATPGSLERPADVLERADRALYRAKEAGRNRACLDPGEATLPIGLNQAPQRKRPAPPDTARTERERQAGD